MNQPEERRRVGSANKTNKPRVFNHSTAIVRFKASAVKKFAVQVGSRPVAASSSSYLQFMCQL